jgi:hypothetical protein
VAAFRRHFYKPGNDSHGALFAIHGVTRIHAVASTSQLSFYHLPELGFRRIEILSIRFHDERRHLIAMCGRLEALAPGEPCLSCFLRKNHGRQKFWHWIQILKNDALRLQHFENDDLVFVIGVIRGVRAHRRKS